MKNLMYSNLESLNCLANVLIVIGFIYIMYLIISIFVNSIVEPVACILSQVIIFTGAVRNDKVSVDISTWAAAIYKLSGFVIAATFLSLGTYIIYYKTVVKVETM